jgi:urease accessory protein
VLHDLHQHANAKLRLPRTHQAGCEAVFINTAGGIAGGDSLALDVEVAAGAQLTVTTQACERVYRSSDGASGRVQNRARLERDAKLCWLPQETILFDQARLNRKLDITMAPRATLLAMETVVFGRLLSGETPTSGMLDDRWRVHCGHDLIHAEHSFLDIAATPIDRIGQLEGRRVIATIFYAAPDSPELTRKKADYLRQVATGTDVACGVSAFGGKLVCRLAAFDSRSLRRCVPFLLAALMPDLQVPKVWQS